MQQHCQGWSYGSHLADLISTVPHYRILCSFFAKKTQAINNLGHDKMEQQTPHPPSKSRMKPRTSQNALFSHPCFGGEGGGGVQIFHLFYPRLKVRVATLVVKPCSYLVSAVKFLIQSTFLNTVNFGTSTMHVSVLEKVK